MSESESDPLEPVRAIFKNEAVDLIQSMDELLLTLGSAAESDRPQKLHELMREMHTLKGGASSLGFAATADLAHALEEHFTSGTWTPSALDTLHQAMDVLRESLDQLTASAAVNAVLAKLREEPSPPPQTVAPSAPQPAAPVEAPTPTDDAVRVSLSRLSALMLDAGELTLRIKQSRERTAPLRELAARLTAAAATAGSSGPLLSALGTELATHLRRFSFEAIRDELLVESLYDSLSSLRLRPLSSVLRSLPRTGRDLARALGKNVQVTVSGGSLEVEGPVLAVLKDALLHLVRNSIDHGVEGPRERDAAGKPMDGRIHVGARVEGSTLIVEVSDDGAGVNPGAVREAALKAKVITAEEAAALSEEAAQELIFRPGFSTREVVTDISGRGVGLDAVKAAITRQRGDVRLASVQGKGTTFTLQLPLVAHRTHALILDVAGQSFAIPSAAVWRVTRFERKKATEVGGQWVVPIEDVQVPIVPLSLQLGLAPQPLRDGAGLVVLRSQDRVVACSVDDFLLDEELVMRELDPLVARPAVLAGFAVRQDGAVISILNPIELVRSAGTELAAGAGQAAAQPTWVVRRVLVVDDSFTMRALAQSILELAGYQVLLAQDGEEALATLSREKVDVVVSDVNMPRKDGFELLAALRQDSRLRTLPFVLVTSRGNDADRKRGLDLGASAYVVKSEFDQERLLEVVGRLSGQ